MQQKKADEKREGLPLRSKFLLCGFILFLNRREDDSRFPFFKTYNKIIFTRNLMNRNLRIILITVKAMNN